MSEKVELSQIGLERLTSELSGSSRRTRQNAAATLAAFAKTDADKLVPYGADLVDALNRPEAQTRWECLDALTELVAHDSRLCDKAIPEAETALFDEDSGPLRLAAMRFLCRLGATTENRSEKVWPLIGVHNGARYANAGIETVMYCGLACFPVFLDRVFKATVASS